jgi:large subunit ribosomal protein L35
MPKMKTHKGLKKRVRVTARGKVKYRASNAGHLLSGKSGNRRRRLRKPHILNNVMDKKMIEALGGKA